MAECECESEIEVSFAFGEKFKVSKCSEGRSCCLKLQARQDLKRGRSDSRAREFSLLHNARCSLQTCLVRHFGICEAVNCSTFDKEVNRSWMQFLLTGI